jgi:hypothetical protein
MAILTVLAKASALGGIAALWLAAAAEPQVEPYNAALFRPIFDGHSLAGWHVSAGSTHSAASGNRSGGRWTVEDGTITGTQDLPGNGGILVSDAVFRDVEIVLEARIDFGVDSGVFLRSTEGGAAYQVTVDYYPGGSIAGIYGEALPGNLFVKTFEFLEAPDRIRLLPSSTPPPITPEAWPRLWRVGDWNELRARIVGNPPTLTTWINGVRVLDYADDRHRLPDTGAIALQVHGGGDHTGQLARYRNIRIRTLD